MPQSSSPDPMSIINSDAPQISDVSKQLAQTQQTLGNSPTAASSNAAPTGTDIRNDTDAQTLQTQLAALQKQSLTAQWYGSDAGTATGATTDTTGTSPGLIGNILDFLQKPLHGVVQGVKDVIGDKTNVPNQDFTDLFAQHGFGGPLGSAAGLTADVLFDPVNWITMGTGALIPRVGYGLAKGFSEAGVEGALDAAKEGAISSSLGHTATFLARKTPFAGGEGGSLYQAFNDRVAQAAENYKNLTGADPEANITSPGILRGTDTTGLGKFAAASGKGLTLSDFTRQLFSYIPHGNDMYNSLYMDSRDWLEKQKIMDAVDKAKVTPDGQSTASAVSQVRGPSPEGAALSEGDSLSSIKGNMQLLKGVPAGQERDAIIDQINKITDDYKTIAADPARMISTTPEENAARIIQDTAYADQVGKILQPIVNQFSKSAGPTGVQWYDNAIKWANGVKMKLGDKEVAPIRAFLDTYNSLIQGAFKPAHTVFSPVVHAMNIMSSVPMVTMLGLEDPLAYMSYYKDSFLGYSGVNPEQYIVRDLIGEPTKTVYDATKSGDAARAADMTNYMRQNPTGFKRSYGVDTSWFFGNQAVSDMVQKAYAAGDVSKEELENGSAEKELLAAQAQMRKDIAAGNFEGPKQTWLASIFKKLGTAVTKPAGTQEDVINSPAVKALRDRVQQAKSGGLNLENGNFSGSSSMLPAGQTVSDPYVTTELADKVSDYIKAKATAGERPFQILQNLMDGAKAGYNREDQAFRTGVLRYVVNRGLSPNELRVISRVVPVTNPETQVISTYVKDGQKMSRMSAEYATQIAHEAAINYAAMPSAIRMLRSMPLVGAPFLSFSYGMGIKTAQAMAYNPSFFNKVAFGIQAASGSKTPLEKEALKSPYYSYLNSPTEMRLPDSLNFFSQYPLYYNLTNALPYYYLNIFQPSSRSYAEALPNDIVNAIDDSQIMKDPIGQALFDNILLPAILAGTNERPMNSMGEPLYPLGATAADKAFYLGRGLVDQFTPSGVAPAGLLLPSQYAKYYPGYRTREMSYGRFDGSQAYPSENELGIPSTESPASRTIRNILSYLGQPVQEANTKYAASANTAGSTP